MSPPPDLVRPFELRSGKVDWRGSWSADDVWDILTASRSGNCDRVSALLAKDPSLVECDYWYAQPLKFAVREGHLDVVKLLVNAGADTSIRSLDGKESLVDSASDRGHKPVVDYLTALSPKTFAKDLPIHLAIKNQNHAEVESLLNNTRDLANTSGHLGRTPLHLAVESEDQKMVKLLIDSGAEVDTTGFSSDDRLGGGGFRPLTLAIWKHPYWPPRDSFEIARLLIEHGAYYSLPIAAALGDFDHIKSLISKGIDPNYEESGGKRALSSAAERNHIGYC